MTVMEVAKKISQLNGKLFLVGGAVRDSFMNKEVHDRDFVVTGISVSDFKKAFNDPPMTGNSFPVFRLEIDNEECEVAFARREKKVSEGHNGFEMDFSPIISIEEDLIRRDITINAIAKDILTNEIIDPFHGIQDIQNHLISAVSHHFVEDPLRVLRVARQAAVFNFHVDKQTLNLMEACKPELSTLPFSRIWKELEKALLSDNPSIFFQVLKDSNTLHDIFPELTDVPIIKGNTLESRFCSIFIHTNSNTIKNWDTERFPKKLKKAALALSEAIKRPLSTEQNILKVFSILHRHCDINTFITVTEPPQVISETLFNEVFKSISVPDSILSKDASTIKNFINQIRLERISNFIRKED